MWDLQLKKFFHSLYVSNLYSITKKQVRLTFFLVGQYLGHSLRHHCLFD